MKTISPDWLRNTLCGIGLAIVALGSTGCQGVYNGQTLPSPWYLSDDIQYFPPGPEFKLSREAAAMKAREAEAALEVGAAQPKPGYTQPKWR